MSGEKLTAMQDKVENLISIVAPVYNEEKVIGEFCERLSKVSIDLKDKYEVEYIFIDDGSKDETLNVLKEKMKSLKQVKIIEFRKNYGQTAAIQAGFDVASGDIIITMDTDLQHFPEEIPKFIERINEGYDVVCGWREKRQEGVVRRWPSKIANMVIRKITGLKINDIGTTFRAYRRQIIKDINILGEQHRFIPVFAKQVGATISELPIKNIERPEGESNYGLGRVVGVFFDLFYLYFVSRYLDRPARLFCKVALMIFSLALVITFFLIYQRFALNISSVKEYSGLFTVGMFFYLISFLLILFGVLAEIQARIYFATVEKQAYKIRKIWK